MRSSFAAILSVTIVLSSLTGCRTVSTWPGMNFLSNAEEAPLYQPNKPSGSPKLPSQQAMVDEAPNTQLGTPTSPASYNTNQKNASNQNNTGDRYNTGIYGSNNRGNQNQLASGSTSSRNVQVNTGQNRNNASLAQRGPYSSTYPESSSTGGSRYSPVYNTNAPKTGSSTKVDNRFAGGGNVVYTNKSPAQTTNRGNLNPNRYSDNNPSNKNTPTTNTGNTSTQDNRYRSEQVAQPKIGNRFNIPNVIPSGVIPRTNVASKLYRPGGTGTFNSIADNGIQKWPKSQNQNTIPVNTGNPASRYAGAESGVQYPSTSAPPAANQIPSGNVNNNFYQKGPRTANGGDRFPAGRYE